MNKKNYTLISKRSKRSNKNYDINLYANKTKATVIRKEDKRIDIGIDEKQIEKVDFLTVQNIGKNGRRNT